VLFDLAGPPAILPPLRQALLPWAGSRALAKPPGQNAVDVLTMVGSRRPSCWSTSCQLGIGGNR